MKNGSSKEICARIKRQKKLMSAPLKPAPNLSKCHIDGSTPNEADDAVGLEALLELSFWALMGDSEEPSFASNPLDGLVDVLSEEQARGRIESQYLGTKPALCHLDGDDLDGEAEDTPTAFRNVKGWHQTRGWSRPWGRRLDNHIKRVFV